MKNTLFSIAAALGMLALNGNAAIINFDSLSQGTVVSTEFSGALFSGAQVLTQGSQLNPPYPPHSGGNVVYDYLAAGIVRVDAVGALWSDAGGYVTGMQVITLTAYDSNNQLLGSVSTPGANYTGAGTGYSPNIFLGITAPGIAYVTFSDHGNTFTLDDFQFSAVPEPSTYLAGALLLLPFGAHAIRRLRTRRQVS